MKIGYDLENVVVVKAPCWLVWQIMCDIIHWPGTSPSLHLGTTGPGFGYTLKPLGLPIRVKAHITAIRDMQLLAWSGRFWGVSSEVKMRFVIENARTTRIIFSEKLSGLGLLLFSALFSMSKLTEINQSWLQSLTQHIEERASQISCKSLPVTSVHDN